ncbi:unnamed protein product [Heligmosomoides polygyrus]|uniref:Uncharacterized protein n=1 Tax=Heligmosomoides polygyrus TaxID=6339 RepID=A0A183FG01_HELPZ|nr:unnamed protein product [Heligmosomoides polygyrus]
MPSCLSINRVLQRKEILRLPEKGQLFHICQWFRVCCAVRAAAAATAHDDEAAASTATAPARTIKLEDVDDAEGCSFEQGEGIRQHLIEEHAKFVAKAFLYPDLSSSIHYWLMACVEYGTPPNDPMISQICSTAATTTDGTETLSAATVLHPDGVPFRLSFSRGGGVTMTERLPILFSA